MRHQMRAFWGILRASLTATSRNPSSVVFGLVFPLVFILAFGFMGDGKTRLDIAFSSQSNLQNVLLKILSEEGSFKRHSLSDDMANDWLRKGKLAAIVSVNTASNGQVVVNLRLSTANPRSGKLVRDLVDGIVTKRNLAALSHHQKLPFGLNTQTVKGRPFTTIDFVLPGQLGFALLASGVFATSFLFMTLRQTLVIKRFFTTPVSRTAIILGEAVSRLIFALVQATVIILVGVFVFHYTLIHGFGTFLQMVIVSGWGLLVFMGIGFVISSVAKDEKTIPPLANLVTMPQFLLAGTFIPIESFPGWLQPVGHLMPLTYLNEALRKIAFEGTPIWGVWTDLAILGVWGIVIYGIAIRLFKWE